MPLRVHAASGILRKSEMVEKVGLLRHAKALLLMSTVEEASSLAEEHAIGTTLRLQVNGGWTVGTSR